MRDRTEPNGPSADRVGTTPDSPQSLRTHWERFFRTAPGTDTEEFDDTVDAPCGAPSREWEVFCRECESEPLTHAGSVRAPTVAVARKQAATLFGHGVETVWLCPADETVRLQVAERDATAAKSTNGADNPPSDRTSTAGERARGGQE